MADTPAIPTSRLRIEIPDNEGNLRGKYNASSKLAKGKGSTLSDVFYVLSIRDDVFEAPLTGVGTGFPDVVMQPDWSTLVPVPWENDLSAVIADVYLKDGTPLDIEPRRQLRKAVERLEATEFEALFGVEYEIYIFNCGEAGDAALRAGRPRDLLSVGREWQAYSLWRFEDMHEFVNDAEIQLRAYGVEIESWSTELGFGMIECASNALPPLQAADTAARFKLGFKELAKRHGLVATFIAKWSMVESGSSGHLHQSLLRNGENAFAGGAMDTLSETGRHYLGGLIDTAAELSSFCTPNVNSYRRPSPELWAPTNASWGWDNRQASIRAITIDQDASRLEYRRPGADLNPYLSIAACLDSGLRGVAEKIEPPAASVGPAYADESIPSFPLTLEEAAEALAGSRLARQWYGDAYVDHYVASRRAEAKVVKDIQNAQVPDYEIARYFEIA